MKMNWITQTVGPPVIKGLLAQQNPEELGIEQAKVVDKILDATFGEFKSEQLQVAIIPFIEKFITGFKKELLRDAG